MTARNVRVTRSADGTVQHIDVATDGVLLRYDCEEGEAVLDYIENTGENPSDYAIEGGNGVFTTFVYEAVLEAEAAIANVPDVHRVEAIEDGMEQFRSEAR